MAAKDTPKPVVDAAASDPALESSPAEPRTVRDNQLELLTTSGEPTGVVVTYRPVEAAEPEPDEDPARTRVRSISRAVTGWSTLEVDGERYTYSQDRAMMLLQRFPGYADQIERAAARKDHK